MTACGILQTDLYQSEFESRHLNNMNVSDYLTTTQMEISGMWGTEVEVIALATLLKTTITILLVQKYLSGITILLCALMLTHQFVFICTILETILTVSRLSQVVCNFHFMQSACTASVFFFFVVHYLSYTRSALHLSYYISSASTVS